VDGNLSSTSKIIGGSLMKKITKTVSTLGLVIVLMGGLFVTSVSATTLKINPPVVSPMSVDPPAH
jgi:mannose/fructose/N-acetylgalactosamine-specific phosphotransferase system component IID